MASVSVSVVLKKWLPNFDEELLDYITAIVDEMSLEEKRSHNSLHEVMGPFIIDTGTKNRMDSSTFHLRSAIASCANKSILEKTAEPVSLMISHVRLVGVS
jgi:hypothetical protein